MRVHACPSTSESPVCLYICWHDNLQTSSALPTSCSPSQGFAQTQPLAMGKLWSCCGHLGRWSACNSTRLPGLSSSCVCIVDVRWLLILGSRCSQDFSTHFFKFKQQPQTHQEIAFPNGCQTQCEYVMLWMDASSTGWHKKGGTTQAEHHVCSWQGRQKNLCARQASIIWVSASSLIRQQHTHTHSKNADLKSHEYLATRKSIQSQLDWSSWWKRMKKIDRHWWCVSYWILICCNLDCLEQCILCCQYSLNISTRSRLVQAQVGKQTCVYSWIMAVFFIDYLSATSRNHILPKNMDA